MNKVLKCVIVCIVGIIIMFFAWTYFAHRFEESILDSDREGLPSNLPSDMVIHIDEDAPVFLATCGFDKEIRPFVVTKLREIKVYGLDWRYSRSRKGLVSETFNPIDLESSEIIIADRILSKNDMIQLFFDMDNHPEEYDVTAKCDYVNTENYYCSEISGDFSGKVVTYGSNEHAYAIPLEYTDLKEQIDKRKFAFPIVGKTLLVGAGYAAIVFMIGKMVGGMIKKDA